MTAHAVGTLYHLQKRCQELFCKKNHFSGLFQICWGEEEGVNGVGEEVFLTRLRRNVPRIEDLASLSSPTDDESMRRPSEVALILCLMPSIFLGKALEQCLAYRRLILYFEKGWFIGNSPLFFREVCLTRDDVESLRIAVGTRFLPARLCAEVRWQGGERR